MIIELITFREENEFRETTDNHVKHVTHNIDTAVEGKVPNQVKRVNGIDDHYLSSVWVVNSCLKTGSRTKQTASVQGAL